MKTLLAAAVLLSPAFALAEGPALTQLRGAAQKAEDSAASLSLEDAAAGNQVWAENAADTSSRKQGSVAAGTSKSAAPAVDVPVATPSRPNLTAKITKPVEDDPVPPKATGWEGFKMGFLGTEALGMRLLSKTGKLCVPLLILLQPIIAPIALIVGLFGIFGKSL
jgi:hypothetical protein